MYVPLRYLTVGRGLGLSPPGLYWRCTALQSFDYDIFKPRIAQKPMVDDNLVEKGDMAGPDQACGCK